MVSRKWPPFMVQCGNILSFLWPGKKVKGQGQNNRSWAQLHHPSQLLKNHDWRSISNSWMSYGVHTVAPLIVSDPHTQVRTDGWHNKVHTGYAGGQQLYILSGTWNHDQSSLTNRGIQFVILLISINIIIQPTWIWFYWMFYDHFSARSLLANTTYLDIKTKKTHVLVKINSFHTMFCSGKKSD